MSTDTQNGETIHHVYNILDFFFLHNPSHKANIVCEYLPLIWMVHGEQQYSESAVLAFDVLCEGGNDSLLNPIQSPIPLLDNQMN